MRKDLVGLRFEKVVVTSYSHATKWNEHIYNFKCDCGKEGKARSAYLTGKRTRSCGCSRIIHGLRKTRLYRIWTNMKSRCYNEKKDNYQYYGGKGIRLCEEWKNSFKAFSEWALSNGYTDELTIDRIDSNGHYEPSNCRWATMKEQCDNRDTK